MSEKTARSPADDQNLQDMIAETDTGARAPAGPASKVLWFVPLAWSLFQLWIASPFPFMVGDLIPIPNNTHTRSIHLGFAVFLTFLAYPALKRSPRQRIPVQDWLWAFVGSFCALYLSIWSDEIAERPGLPNTPDLIFAGLGLVFLLEATRRALGPPLMVVASVFLLYVFFGDTAPEVIAWKGASFEKAMSHLWLTQEGVFGVAIGVSTSMVFLFVLFGALLERAGAGNYFIRVAFALLGHMRGGPAKAAVVSSGMTGLISGSSIANVVTTGTFTIPLMKRVGFPSEKAGAVEVASSTNGQLTPPIMGAAAFLMVEYVGISYVEVIKHAFLPAVISYIALVYIVHLEALKADIQGLPRRVPRTWVQSLMTFLLTVIGIGVLTAVVTYGMGWIKGVAGAATPWVAAAILAAAYLALLKYATLYPDLDPHDPMDELPAVGPTVKSGLYFVLPVIVLIWCLVVERLSPGLSAFWAAAFLVVVLLTQRPLKAMMRGEGAVAASARLGVEDTLEGMVAGARNMIGIGVATAAAGIIVGTVTLTGVGLVMTEFVEFISGGNLLLMLLFTAIISLILGMGLPTTANYIVVSSLMAQVIVTLGAEAGLIVPLIAVHLFVFYFGILADDTPPVGLAAFAAAAISGGDPIKTGIQGFTYDIRTAILPFMFIFNTQLLMIGIDSWWEFVLTVASAVTAMLVFAAATQGFFLVRTRVWETVALLLVTFTLLRPGFWMDMIVPPLETVPAGQVYEAAEGMAARAQIRLEVAGEDLEGNKVHKVVMLPLGERKTGLERLTEAGLELREEDGKMIIDNVVFGSPAERQKLDFDWEILSVQRDADRVRKEVMFLPALALLGLVVVAQRARRRAAAPAPA